MGCSAASNFGVIESAFSNGYEGEKNEDGDLHGFGKHTLKDNSVYEGEFKNGRKCGKGMYTFANGMKCEANMNLKRPLVANTTLSGISNGTFNLRTGHTFHEYKAGDIYEGEIFNDNFNGIGTLTEVNGTTYTGSFVSGLKSGHGVQKYRNGENYVGQFERNMYNGKGKLTRNDGTVLDGMWVDGTFQTPIFQIMASSQKRLEGPFFNILKSSEYVTNSRGQILHVRSWVNIQDGNSKPSALVFFLHGYASHISRPVHEKIACDLNTHNIGYITLDFHGHGHSDGLRALVASYIDLVDDIVSLLLAVYSTSTVNSEQNYRIAQTFDTDVPFFIMGHSMGGAITLLTANFLTRSTLSNGEEMRFTSIEKQWKGICSAFKGCLLFAPAVEVNSPSIFLRGLLTYVLVPLIPTVEIPPSFSSLSDNSLTWEDPTYIDYVVADAHPVGLSWGGSLRIQTAWALLNAADEVKASIANMTYPFIVFHDPEDAICRVKGSEMLLTGSTLIPESDKKLVKVDGGRHDLITNRLPDMITQSVEWIYLRLSLCSSVPEPIP